MPNSTALREVLRAVGVGLGQRLAERGAGAARPEQQPDREAHRAADRDVLDPHQPDLPARGREDVEEDQQRERERGLAGGEARSQRARGRRAGPPAGAAARAASCSVPISATSARADDEPGDRAEQAADHVLPGAQRVRAQHRERAEHDPEGVLHAGEVGDQHRKAEADGAADAVLQPQRVRLDVGAGALLGGRERARRARRLAAEQLVEPAAPLGGRGQVDVARDLRRRRSSAPVRGSPGRARRSRRPSAPRRLAAVPALTGSSVAPRSSSVERARAARPARRAARRGDALRRVEQVGAALEHRRRPRLHRARRADRRAAAAAVAQPARRSR